MRILLLVMCILAAQVPVLGQNSPEAAYNRLLELTSIFRGYAPFSCNAIVEVKYKNNASRPIRDTSKLIYRDRMTYYRSSIVERVEGSEGELIINHELKAVSYHLSDSIKEVIQKELNVKPDRQIEAMLEENIHGSDVALFKKFLTEQCAVTWETKDGLEEISFTPKKPKQATLLSVKIRSNNAEVRHYEYTYRDVYATDYYGKAQFRVIRTLYQGFNYDNVPQIPVRLSDLLQWDGWTVKLKKYTNYKLSVL